MESDSDDGACGSDNDTGAGKRAGGKAGGGDQVPLSAAQAAADAALRRVNAAGASGAAGGPAARTSGGGSNAFGANRFGSRPSFDDNVNLVRPAVLWRKGRAGCPRSTSQSASNREAMKATINVICTHALLPYYLPYRLTSTPTRHLHSATASPPAWLVCPTWATPAS